MRLSTFLLMGNIVLALFIIVQILVVIWLFAEIIAFIIREARRK